MVKTSAISLARLRTSTVAERNGLARMLLLRLRVISVQRSGTFVRHFRISSANSRTVLHRNNGNGFNIRSRNIGTIGALLRSITRLRYIVIGGIAGGGYTLSQKYDELRDQFPDLRQYLPEGEYMDQLSEKAAGARLRWAERLQRASSATRDRAKSLTEWASDAKDKLLVLSPAESSDGSTELATDAAFAMTSLESATTSTRKDAEKVEKLQDELMGIQGKYQKEVERLERENKDLKRLVLQAKSGKDRGKRKVKRTLIDMYSEVLDYLSDYDSSYSTQDHLPRVVVVGDQSSGKTSVLEMIAKARLFPRGAGEMMTRAPVKVTLSEGPYHIAQFKDSSREFDLTKESELSELRREIEIRMRNSVKGGKTVSNDVIALTVKGANLPRMVLVDLPGVISTVTTDMARDTKDDITRMCRQHMENPNAIILCIQDGSVDAERSNVTDLVSSMDPKGRRTILVLTKVDLAESNLTNPDRIRKILEGKLFPMKALGYYAVVTGRGATNDSIETIRKYEDSYFKNSKLFREGVLKPSQMTTANMSLAVSECFWKMVKTSVEAQADAFRATRFNLETEWKNNFPMQRELDRDELFDKARSEILDEIINLSQVTPKTWEGLIHDKLCSKVENHVFENVYIPATLAKTTGEFNTLVDIRLKHWTENLPSHSVEVGWDSLRTEFNRIVEQDARQRGHDDVFDTLKRAVLAHAMEKHDWDKKAVDYLRVIQRNTIEDRNVPDKSAWDESVKFMEQAVRNRLDTAQENLDKMKGPGNLSRWLKWSSLSEQNVHARAVERELKKVISSDPTHRPALTSEEVTTVRHNVLQNEQLDVEAKIVQDVWYRVFRTHFLQRALSSARDCKNFFYHYQRGFGDTEVDCNAVVLFWRVQRMLSVTSNALRQQIINTESRRLEKELKDVLEDWATRKDIKQEYLTGRRVALAEELKRVRTIQEKLDEFVLALSEEKKS